MDRQTEIDELNLLVWCLAVLVFVLTLTRIS
jgi:hypothetical protein